MPSTPRVQPRCTPFARITPRLGACACAAIVAALFTITPPAHADLVSIVADRDATLYQDATGSTANGAGRWFFSGITAMESIRRGLLHFEIAGSLPAGATISRASVRLTMDRGISGAAFLTLHRVQQGWGEGPSVAPEEQGAGTPALAGDATWLHTFYTGSLWNTPGGDFNEIPSAILSVADVGQYTWTSAALAADAQAMLDTPSSNHGWVLLGDEFSVPPTAKRFASRESPDETARPVLVIEYIVPSPASTLPLALAGALGWTKRKRRSSAAMCDCAPAHNRSYSLLM